MTKSLKKKYIFAFLILTVYIIVNIAFSIFVPLLFSFLKIDSSIILFLFFIVLNLSVAFLFKLFDDLKNYWSVSKSYFFLIGFIGWLLISGVAFCLKLLLGSTDALNSHDLETSIWSGLGITILIVAWEELMFRGIILNYLLKFSSKLYLSFISGLLFMLIHLLNPEIDLTVQGLNLFAAGFLLAYLYLEYKNIWFPLGVHFANNIFHSKVEFITGYRIDPNNALISHEGYIDTAFLILTCLIVYRLRIRE